MPSLVRGLLLAGATLLAAAAAARVQADPVTSMRFEGDPDGYVAAGQTFTLTPADGVITAEKTEYGLQVRFGFYEWVVNLAAPGGGLPAPGVYEAPRGQWTPVTPGLDVYGGGRGCEASPGRFTVLEAVYGPGGEVQSFAADYEYRCVGFTGALFGSVRVNSSVTDGVRLSVAPAVQHEGNGQPIAIDFTVSLSHRLPTPVTFDYATADGTAKAGVDYTPNVGTGVTIVPGQTAAIIGVGILGNLVPQQDRTLTMAVSNVQGAPVAFAPGIGTIADDDVAPTQLHLDGQAGEPLSAGRSVTLLPSDGSFDAVNREGGGIEVTVRGLEYWQLRFFPPEGAVLEVGTYEDAYQFPSPTNPGLAVSGNGLGCDQTTGRFEVKELVRLPGGGIGALAIDFEQHCDSQPALYGSLRFHSSLPPTRHLSAPSIAKTFFAPTVALHGAVRMSISSFNANSDDALTGVAFSDALPAGLVVATPANVDSDCVGTLSAEPGSSVVSLSGATLPPTFGCDVFVDVEGSAPGIVNNSVSVTSTNGGAGNTSVATVEVGELPTFLHAVSDPGDVVGGGLTSHLTPADGPFTLHDFGSALSLSYDGPPETPDWSLAFSTPSGMPLVPGVYEGAVRAFFRSPALAGMEVTGLGACNGGLHGRFVVLEAQRGPEGLQTLAVDFEQRCDGADAALLGSLRYKSLLPVTPRLSVAPAAAYEGDGEPKSLTFAISLSARAPSTVTVRYATADDTAHAGTDYLSTSGTATIPAGRTSAVVSVPVLGNAVPQPDRALRLVLSSPAGAPLAFGEAAGTVLDDDSARSLVRLEKGPAGADAVVVLTPLDAPFSLASASLRSVSVHLNTDGLLGLNLSFSAPAGETLGIGAYENAATPPFSDAATLLVSPVAGCSPIGGRFDVLELTRNDEGDALTLAVDFEQHCAGGAPTLFGSVRVNSAIPPRIGTPETPPGISATGATDLVPDGATLHATVSPNGTDTVAWLELGRSTAYGETTMPRTAGGDSGPLVLSEPVFGLGCGTYHFRAVAVHAGTGLTAVGPDVELLTAHCAKGDANGDGSLAITDVFYLVNDLFAGGPGPADPATADVNGDGELTVLDVFYLINHLFAGGPGPK